MLQVAATYDFRLAIAMMEYRDGYFTDLKVRIELLYNRKRQKVYRLYRLPACKCLVFHCRYKEHARSSVLHKAGISPSLSCHEATESQAFLMYPWPRPIFACLRLQT